MNESVAGQNTGSTHQKLKTIEREHEAQAQKLARTGVPYALNTAAAWSWRLIVVAGAGWLVWQGLSKVSLLIVSAMVAALLAALLSPAVYAMRKHGIRAGGATAIAEIGMILGVAALLALTGQQLVRGFISLTSNVIQGYQQLVDWLKSMGYELGADQLNQVLDQVEQVVSNNPSTVLRGVSEVGSTAAELATGVLITLFTLVFFLMEGERIWLFIVKLCPQQSRDAVNAQGGSLWVRMCGWRSWWPLLMLWALVLVPPFWGFRWRFRWAFWFS